MRPSKIVSSLLLLLAASGCAGPGANKNSLLKADAAIRTAEQNVAAARAAQSGKFSADFLQRADIDLGAARSARRDGRGPAAIHEAESAAHWAREAKVASDSARPNAAGGKPSVARPIPEKKPPAKKTAK